MTDKAASDTKRLRELAKAATPGPWEFWDKRGWPTYDRPLELGGKQDGILPQSCYGVTAPSRTIPGHSSNVTPWTVEDAAYIAAIHPAVVLSLLDRIEELERHNRRLLEIIEEDQPHGLG